MDKRDINETKTFENAEVINKPETLIEFAIQAETSIQMTSVEAQLLIDYMEGHDYVLGVCDNELVRGDIAEGIDHIIWEEYSLENAIDIVCEWNYELILAEDAKRNNPDNFIEFVNADSYYKTLKDEEVILDNLFGQTHISKELEEMAERLADKAENQANEQSKDQFMKADGKELPFR